MKLLHKTLLFLPLIAMGFTSAPAEKLIDLKLASYTFHNKLSYEVVTSGEQEISLSVTHESGKVLHRENRLLYGEAYLELDASDFPKGMYSISVTCQRTEIMMKTEKI
ncbi:MAG TPA: hypothetical protein VK177_17395 [Flavobacteriales bacterium]|nr:hypothetical protein [Flavobacteriales bacterium]